MEMSATAKENRKARYDAWLKAEGIEFKSPETEKKYKASIQRMIDAIEREKTPDRVPLFPLGTFMQADLYGVTPKEAMYDYGKMLNAQKQYLIDYDPDYYASPAFIGSGHILEKLGLTMYKWPGGGGLPDTSGYQCVEAEYMTADDYDWFMEDPSDFWLRKYVPSIFSALAPLASLSSLTALWEIVGMSPFFIPFGTPPVQEALKTLMEVGDEALKWISEVGAFEADVRSLGYPTVIGGATKAPYDVLADTLRGTRGTMMDLFRQPDKLLKALDTVLPIFTKQGIGMADQAQNPIVFMPLHKGADGFMSDEQFKKFYWPTFKQMILDLVEAGCVPFLFCEGGYNSRLEYLKELPKGSCFWIFDRTDMTTAKKEIGENLCIGGNVPAGMILTSTTDDVKAYCKNLIDTCAPGGGYIMAFGTAMDEGNSENLHAMFDFTKEYGKY